MKIVSFYSDIDGQDYYSKNAEKLIQNCKDLGMDFDIRNENFGNSWIDNVRAKPVFLLKMLNELKQDFIWLDVDCVIHKKIDFNLDSDWMIDYRINNTPHDYIHIIKYNQSNIDFINRWIKEIEIEKRGSHTAFINIYKSIETSKIPGGYFSIGLAQTDSKTNYMKQAYGK